MFGETSIRERLLFSTLIKESDLSFDPSLRWLCCAIILHIEIAHAQNDHTHTKPAAHVHETHRLVFRPGSGKCGQGVTVNEYVQGVRVGVTIKEIPFMKDHHSLASSHSDWWWLACESEIKIFFVIRLVRAQTITPTPNLQHMFMRRIGLSLAWQWQVRARRSGE